MKHNKNSFQYLGKTFTPLKRLTNKQIRLENVSSHLNSDFELGFSTYDGWENKKDYTYEGFYKACGEKYFDLFRCEENGKVYMPCQNELFQYV